MSELKWQVDSLIARPSVWRKNASNNVLSRVENPMLIGGFVIERVDGEEI